jgi:hypothetical protein
MHCNEYTWLRGEQEQTERNKQVCILYSDYFNEGESFIKMLTAPFFGSALVTRCLFQHHAPPFFVTAGDVRASRAAFPLPF